jgi:hypothetical protein
MLMSQSLWVLRNLLEAGGKNVPDAVVNLDIRKLLGMELGVTVADEEYEGRIYSDVKDFVSLDILEGSDEEEEEDEEGEEEEEEEEEEDEDLTDLDLDEL